MDLHLEGHRHNLAQVGVWKSQNLEKLIGNLNFTPHIKLQSKLKSRLTLVEYFQRSKTDWQCEFTTI